MLVPQESVAPIGTVVLLAGTRDRDNYLRTNQRIDWTLVPGSVGQFVEVGTKGFTDWLMGDFTVPQIVARPTPSRAPRGSISATLAALPSRKTTSRCWRARRWITTTSLVEGTMWVNPCPGGLRMADARRQSTGSTASGVFLPGHHRCRSAAHVSPPR